MKNDLKIQFKTVNSQSKKQTEEEVCSKVAMMEWSPGILDRRTQFIAEVFNGQKHFHL